MNIYDVLRSFSSGCVFMSGVRTRNSPGLSTDSSPHQKLRYSIPSRLDQCLNSATELFNSVLPPLRSYPCSCCSCRICTLCQRSSWSTGRSETRNLLKVNPNLRATNLQYLTYRFIRSSRRLWMGSSHAWRTRWVHTSANISYKSTLSMVIHFDWCVSLLASFFLNKTPGLYFL